MKSLFELLETYRRYDPATNSKLEIFFLYPGVKAIGFHRIAHRLRELGVPFFPRFFSEMGRFFTGIDIHPGATIGKNLIIDHGMGVVIGETAEIGNNVIIYQGVTLGGTDLKKVKRHPTLCDHVVIGAGAKVLGAITIGEGSRVGANSVVVDHVPEHTTVVGIPAKQIKGPTIGIRPGQELRHDHIKEEY